jgi:hypothetical protein
MPLDIKINIRTTENCKNLVIEDVTGDFNSTTNIGGWGNPNQSSDLSNDSINIFLTAYHFIDNIQYTTSFQVPESVYYTAFPLKNSIKGFKISIPSDVISTAISNQLSLEPNIVVPESYNVAQETLEDNIYQAIVRIKIPNEDSIISNPVDYTSTCNMKKQVESLLTSIDLSCTDCDKSNFDKALLAKSILEGLENE